MTIISDAAESQRIAYLDDEVRAIGARLDEAKDVLGDAKARHGELGRRIARESRRRPSEAQRGADALVDALAADPKASLSTGGLDKLVEERAKGERSAISHDALVSALKEAQAKLQGEIEEMELNLVSLKREHNQAWRGFVQVAQSAMVAELRVRFARLHEEVIGPLVALSHARDLHGGELAISDRIPQLSPDSLLKLVWYVSGTSKETLAEGMRAGAPSKSDGATLTPSPAIVRLSTSPSWKSEDLLPASVGRGSFYSLAQDFDMEAVRALFRTQKQGRGSAGRS